MNRECIGEWRPSRPGELNDEGYNNSWSQMSKRSTILSDFDYKIELRNRVLAL